MLAEAGILEVQALLLCASIRRFAGVCSGAAITVVSPRADRRPSSSTLGALRVLGAEYLPLDLKSPCPAYGPSFKVMAAAHLARRPGPPILVQTDSDTLFLDEPDLTLCGMDAAARPVDVKGMCTSGEGDRFDPYWRRLCDLCGINYDDIPEITTTIDRRRVRASYNGGLVAVRRDSGILEKTEDCFLRLAAAELVPHEDFTLRTGSGIVSGIGTRYWGTSQAALSLALTAIGHRVRVLPESYNVPLHFEVFRERPSNRPIHVHYHWLGEAAHCGTGALLGGRVIPSPEAQQWLIRRLPLDSAIA